MSHASDFPGYPRCPMPSTLAKITVDNRSFLLHRDVAPLFEMFLKALVARGYRLDRGDQLDDWSFSCRPIKRADGTTIKGSVSEHSRACAIDINATTNPKLRGVLVTDMPSWVPLLAAHYDISWGGVYFDPMHWEYLKTKVEAQRKIRELRGQELPAIDDLPGIMPTDPPGQIRFLQNMLNIIRESKRRSLITVDGKYGDQTKAAVAEFQEDWESIAGFHRLINLDIEHNGGAADPDTCRALGIAVKLVLTAT